MGRRIAQYTIKVPGAALLTYPTQKKDILWKHRLGNYADDVNLRGLRLRKILEGWAYDLTLRGSEYTRCQIRVLNGWKDNQPQYKERDIQAGDWYVKFVDGSWTVMNADYLKHYEKKVRQEREKRIAESNECKEILEMLNVEDDLITT